MKKIKLITTGQIATEMGLSGTTILTYAKSAGLGSQFSGKKNAPVYFTEDEAKKIRNRSSTKELRG